MATLQDNIYAAGLIDGEGCLSIALTGSLPHKRHVIRVRVKMTHEPVVRWLCDTYGGSFRREPRSVAHWKTAWGREVSGRKAETVLDAISPFLRVKKQEAEILREFRASRTLGRGRNLLSVEERALREGYRLAMQEAKR